MKLSSQPLVTIVIPHFNGIEIISECLESLQNSTYSNIEIIVVDNASMDDSINWLKNHHSDVQLIRNEKNLGRMRIEKRSN